MLKRIIIFFILGFSSLSSLASGKDDVNLYCKSVYRFQGPGLTGDIHIKINVKEKTCFFGRDKLVYVADDFYQCDIIFNNKNYVFVINRYTGSATISEENFKKAVEEYSCASVQQKF